MRTLPAPRPPVAPRLPAPSAGKPRPRASPLAAGSPGAGIRLRRAGAALPRAAASAGKPFGRPRGRDGARGPLRPAGGSRRSRRSPRGFGRRRPVAIRGGKVRKLSGNAGQLALESCSLEKLPFLLYMFFFSVPRTTVPEWKREGWSYFLHCFISPLP